MIYNIILPRPQTIDAMSFKDAIKRYIRDNEIINNESRIRQMIIADQYNHMNANIKYYTQDGRNKMGIDMYPMNYVQVQQLVPQNMVFTQQYTPVPVPVPATAAVSVPTPVPTQPEFHPKLIANYNKGYPEFKMSETPPTRHQNIFSMIPLMEHPLSPIVSYDSFIPTVFNLPVKQ
jgi:hypothetical protein